MVVPDRSAIRIVLALYVSVQSQRMGGGGKEL